MVQKKMAKDIHYIQEIKRIYSFKQSDKSKEQNLVDNSGMNE